MTRTTSRIVPKVWRLLHRHDSRIFQEQDGARHRQEGPRGGGPRVRRRLPPLPAGHVHRRASTACSTASRTGPSSAACSRRRASTASSSTRRPGTSSSSADAPRRSRPSPAEHARLQAAARRARLQARAQVARFHFAGEVPPGKVTLRDCDFKKPALSLEGDERRERATPTSRSTTTPASTTCHGATATRARKHPPRGAGAARHDGLGRERRGRRLLPGYTLHARASTRATPLNAEYLLTRVEHCGIEPRGWAASGEDGEAALRQPLRAASRRPCPSARRG